MKCDREHAEDNPVRHGYYGRTARAAILARKEMSKLLVEHRLSDGQYRRLQFWGRRYLFYISRLETGEMPWTQSWAMLGIPVTPLPVPTTATTTTTGREEARC